MSTESLLRSIRRWLITATFLLAVLLVLQTWSGPVPTAVAAVANLVGVVVALVSVLWLWQSFRGATGGDAPQPTAED